MHFLPADSMVLYVFLASKIVLHIVVATQVVAINHCHFLYCSTCNNPSIL